MTTPNPFELELDRTLDALIRLASSPALLTRVGELPDEPVARVRRIDDTLAAGYADEEHLVRVTPRWFEEPAARMTAERYTPQAGASTGIHANKASVCMSLGAPTKGIGVCLSVGR